MTIFIKTKLLVLLAPLTLAACMGEYVPDTISLPTQPVELIDGSVQQSVFTRVWDTEGCGEAISNINTYHGNAHGMNHVSSGTATGQSTCAAAIGAVGLVLAGAVAPAASIANSVDAVTSSVSTANANSGSN